MLDEDGYLFVAGRTDDTIIRGGENIAPAEIEEVLFAIPPCSEEACVVGIPDDEWGQRIERPPSCSGEPGARRARTSYAKIAVRSRPARLQDP